MDYMTENGEREREREREVLLLGMYVAWPLSQSFSLVKPSEGATRELHTLVALQHNKPICSELIYSKPNDAMKYLSLSDVYVYCLTMRGLKRC